MIGASVTIGAYVGAWGSFGVCPVDSRGRRASELVRVWSVYLAGHHMSSHATREAAREAARAVR